MVEPARHYRIPIGKREPAVTPPLFGKSVVGTLLAPIQGEAAMPVKTKDVRVRPGDAVDLKQWPTRFDTDKEPEHDAKALLDANGASLSALQELLYASARHAVLIIFQAMDAAGKDGAIKHVMSGVNPQGCDVTSYGPPSAMEVRHDFLWRAARDLPARGMIGIFNRSYYEEVLVVRVQPELLAAQAVAEGAAQTGEFWRDRYQSITDFERHLHRNGTRIVKIFLHISKAEQRKRLLARIDDAQKNWKFSAADVAPRKQWKLYRQAYEECLAATSTKEAPWYVVPADDKRAARLMVSQIIVETLQDLELSLPAASAKRLRELQAMRADLEAD